MWVNWTDSALSDVLNITDFIGKDDVEAADAISNKLQNAANSLADFPHKGTIGRVEDTRELVAHPRYILVYAVLEDRVDILSVLHTSRQYPPV